MGMALIYIFITKFDTQLIKCVFRQFDIYTKVDI